MNVYELKSGWRCLTRDGTVMIAVTNTPDGVMFMLKDGSAMHESVFNDDLTAKSNGEEWDIMRIHRAPKLCRDFMKFNSKGELEWQRVERDNKSLSLACDYIATSYEGCPLGMAEATSNKNVAKQFEEFCGCKDDCDVSDTRFCWYKWFEMLAEEE